SLRHRPVRPEPARGGDRPARLAAPRHRPAHRAAAARAGAGGPGRTGRRAGPGGRTGRAGPAAERHRDQDRERGIRVGRPGAARSRRRATGTRPGGRSMSQPAAAGPPAATAPAPSPPTPSHHPTGRAAVTPASPATAPARAAAPGQQVSLTPRRLRQWMLVVVAGGLLFGVLGLISYGLQAQAMIRADANTAQLIRVQTIQTDLLTADATVSNAFLVGGLEPAEQRQRYDRAIEAVNRLIAEAAQAQPADAEALAALNTRV